MKKTFIVIAMLLLVFAISCDGDNPAPGDTPSTSLPGIPDSAPDDFTPVEEKDREAFVSTAISYFDCIYDEEEILSLFGQDSSGTVNEETFSGTISHSSDSVTVSLKFDGFVLTKLAQEKGTNIKLWGEYITTGKDPSGSSTDPSQAPDMSGNASFNLVMELSGQTVPTGTYQMQGKFSSTDKIITVYLNGDPVTTAMPVVNF